MLSFYQERHANEAYIGTARERLSIGELARLIGYRLHPGAAAETDLVLPDGRPARRRSRRVADARRSPAGTRVQSQPGPGETAQVFETLEPLTRGSPGTACARARAGASRRRNGDTGAWLAGQPPALQPATPADRRRRAPVDDRRLRRLGLPPRHGRVDPRRPPLDRTRVPWDHPLDSVATAASEDLRLYHLRDRAALFGYNAPHPQVLSEEARDGFGYVDDPNSGSDASPSRILGSDSDPGDWSSSSTSAAARSRSTPSTRASSPAAGSC